VAVAVVIARAALTPVPNLTWFEQERANFVRPDLSGFVRCGWVRLLDTPLTAQHAGE